MKNVKVRNNTLYRGDTSAYVEGGVGLLFYEWHHDVFGGGGYKQRYSYVSVILLRYTRGHAAGEHRITIKL